MSSKLPNLTTDVAPIRRTPPPSPPASSPASPSTSPVALALNLIKSFEVGDWGPGATAAAQLGVHEQTLAATYLEALNWAAEALAAS